MRLPNATRAFVDVTKLRDYGLNARHPRGRHKARVFASALGLTERDADVLRDHLLDAARTGEVTPLHEDAYGKRYLLDFEMTGPAGHARIRSAWIVRRNEDFARLVTCYVL